MSFEIPKISVLYQDGDLVVCDKPPGMNVHRDVWSRPGDLYVLQTLRNQLGRRLFPVHRLDHNSSGALAFAFSSEVAAELQGTLAQEDCEKRYLVLAREQTPLCFASTRPLRNELGEPRPCRTEFRTLARLPRASLIEATLHSGRKHQIRRHLNHLGHHVIGDTTHGKGKTNRYWREEFGLPRMFLHAHLLEFTHPASEERIRCEAPLPQDLASFLGRACAPVVEV